jgi:hypothetical protein
MRAIRSAASFSSGLGPLYGLRALRLVLRVVVVMAWKLGGGDGPAIGRALVVVVV